MFRDAYTRRHGLDTESYQDRLLADCLYWHARLLKGMLPRIRHDLLEADIDLIHAISSLSRRSQFNDCIYEHRHHPHNKGPLRKLLRLRVSVKKLQRVFYDCVPPSEGSTPPVTQTRYSSR